MGMQVYMAATVGNNFVRSGRIAARLDDFELKCMDSVEHMLESYHYVGKQTMVDKMRYENRKFFLDSGAFSAFTQGVEIDLKEFCRYIERNSDLWCCVSVLDAIGDYKGTYHNQRKMEAELPRDLWPLPCYHYGEPVEVLKHYIDNYAYITIGGMVPISTAQLTIWLDEIWPIICDPHGVPRVKVHGFGLTSLPLMLRYPWFSVDSSSWIMFGNNGMILLPGAGRAVNVSSKSGRRKDADAHIDTFAPIVRDALEAEIRKEGGDPQRLRDLYYSRWAWNAWAIPEYVKRRGGGLTKFVQVQEGLF